MSDNITTKPITQNNNAPSLTQEQVQATARELLRSVRLSEAQKAPPMPNPLSLNRTCPELFERVIQKIYPDMFIGENQIDQASIADVKASLRNPTGFSRTEGTAALTHKLLDFIETVERNRTSGEGAYDQAFANNLKQQLHYVLENKCTDYGSFLASTLGYLLSISEINEDELSFLRFVPEASSLEELLKNKDWKNLLKVAFDDNDSDADTHYAKIRTKTSVYYSSTADINYSALDKLVKKELKNNSSSPMQFLYPVFGESVLGLSPLFKHYNNGTFLIGAQDKKNRVHSTILGPVGFATHDAAHANVDPREDVVENWIKTLVIKSVEKGHNIREAVKPCTTFVVERYVAFHKLYETVYQRIMMTSLVHHKDPALFQRLMVGLFLQMHEYPTFDEKTYASGDLSGIFANLYAEAQKGVGYEFREQKDLDPLKTSPFDGKSTLSDQEIKAHFEAELRKDPGFKDRTIEEIKLFHEPYGVAAKIMLKDGSNKWFTENSLYYKWKNLDDMLGLLAAAGVQVQKPQLNPNSIEASRTITKDTMIHVGNELERILEDTNRYIQYIINTQGSEESNYNSTLQEEYMHESLPHAHAFRSKWMTTPAPEPQK